MPSKARQAFDQNADDIVRLLEIHSDLSGKRKGRRFRMEVLNKSAVVLITAFWEGYCEDLAAEALKHIVDHAPDSSRLPVELKKKVAKELRADPNEIASWDLADRGWQSVLNNRLIDLTKERNRRLNTPKAQNIVDLFSTALGLDDVSKQWRWKKMSVQQARAKLDKYVELRGAIAHRGQAATSCTKKQVKDYFAHVKHLVAKTGGNVNRHTRQVTGLKLF